MMNINMQYLICNVNMHACEKIIDNCTNNIRRYINKIPSYLRNRL